MYSNNKKSVKKMVKIFNVKDASLILQCSERYLSDQIRDKTIKAYFVARKYLIMESDLVEYVKSHDTNLMIHSDKNESEKPMKKELLKSDNKKSKNGKK
jgi:excisionase family DNA binding protein